MINDNQKNNTDQNASGAKGPVTGDKLKEYGKKAYGPLVNVVTKYQDEFTPYLNALAKGLKSGGDALSQEGAGEPEKYVARFFNEAAEGLNGACEKLGSKDVSALGDYISDMATKRPSLMFGTSYIAGIFFGRLARHILSRNKSFETSAMKDDSLMSDDMNERGKDFQDEKGRNFSINSQPEIGKQIH